MKPREPKENGTTGGTGPLNIDAACNIKHVAIIKHSLAMKHCSRAHIEDKILVQKRQNDQHTQRTVPSPPRVTTRSTFAWRNIISLSATNTIRVTFSY